MTEHAISPTLKELKEENARLIAAIKFTLEEADDCCDTLTSEAKNALKDIIAKSEGR